MLCGNPIRSALSSQIAKSHVESIACSEFIEAYYLEVEPLGGFIWEFRMCAPKYRETVPRLLALCEQCRRGPIPRCRESKVL